MRVEAAFDNVHIGSAANGKSIPANSPSADGADVQNTAAKSVKKALGAVTASGAWRLSQAMATVAIATDTTDMAAIATATTTARTITIIIKHTTS